jgi:hypothetical protein
VGARHDELLEEIRSTKKLPDGLDAIVKTFKSEFNPSETVAVTTTED